MSHYTVHVVVEADDQEAAQEAVDAALEPFSEHAEVDLYEEEIDAETVSRALAGEDQRRSEVDKALVNRYDYIEVGEVLGSYVGSTVRRRSDKSWVQSCRWNPNGHWDWWVLGGRWRGAFLLRPQVPVGVSAQPWFMERLGGTDPATQSVPLAEAASEAVLGLRPAGGSEPEDFSGRADLARVRDIDLPGMRTLAGHRAEGEFDAYAEAVAGLTPGPTWREVMHAHGGNADAARGIYRADPWVQAAGQFLFGDPHEHWCVDAEDPRAAYVARAVTSVGVPYAWLQDGEWAQQGYIGMFMAATEVDHDTAEGWQHEVAARWDALDANLWVANVDCHT